MNSARGSSAATTKASARHRPRAANRSPLRATSDGAAAGRLTADERVVLVIDRLLPERQHVEIASVRDLDLEQALGAHGGGAPVVDEPDEPLDGCVQVDLDLRDRRHGRRKARGPEEGHEYADLKLVDWVARQIEHRMPETGVRARVALLGDD